jgi:hypothetical protein
MSPRVPAVKGSGKRHGAGSIICGRPSRRTNVFIKLLPFIAIAAAIFGAIFVYIGWNSYVGGAAGWGIGIGLFGLIGVVLAILLWRAGARLGASSRTPGDG